MLDFLTENLKKCLRRLDIQKLFEIRVRQNMPVTVNYEGVYYYLTENGCSIFKENSETCTQEEILQMIYAAGEFSLYSVQEQIKQGFITTKQGVRIGLAGEYVFERGQPLTIRNISALCIRVPHQIKGCGEEIYKNCFSKSLSSLLLTSLPGQGKTTILRDLAEILAVRNQKNVLICDERGEICNGKSISMCDIISYADKKTSLEAGIRAMRPDIIVTDELSKEDLPYIRRALASGVYVIASAHLSTMEHIKQEGFDFFDFYAILSQRKIGVIEKIYRSNGEDVYRA